MNHDGLARLLADLIGLPVWLRRIVLRATGAALAVTFLLSPETAVRAVELYGASQSERILELLTPVLAHPTTQLAHPKPAKGEPRSVRTAVKDAVHRRS